MKSKSSKSSSTSRPIQNGANSSKSSSRRKTQVELDKDSKGTTGEVWTCKFCKTDFKNDDDKLLICDRCDMYVCLPCTNGTVTPEFYDLLSNENCTSQWFCNDCYLHAKTAVKEDRKIEIQCQNFCKELQDDMYSKFNAIENRFTKLDVELKNRFEALEKTINSLGNNTPSKITEQVKEIETKMKLFSEAVKQPGINDKPIEKDTSNIIRNSAKEISDRDRKRNNVIWFGIPEKDSSDVKVRIEHDKQYVENVMDSVFKLDQKDSIVKVLRLGKFDSKAENPRPVLAVYNSCETAKEILSNGRLLGDDSNTDYKNVAVKKDMTPLEREEHKRLLMIRKQKIEETKKNGTSEIWAIRNGTVVDVSKRRRDL